MCRISMSDTRKDTESRMKKIILMIGTLLTGIAITGCSGADKPNNPAVSASSAASAVSQNESSAEESHSAEPIDNQEALKILDEVIAQLDTSSLEAFTKSFSDRSEQEYISNSYVSLVGGFIVGEKVCIYQEDDTYIFAFKAAYMARDGEQIIMLLPVVMENNVPKILLDQPMMQKASAAINDYLCPVCRGTGKNGESSKCSECDGFGYILHEHEKAELTKEII